jgi:flavin-dependent dehydrogenase
VDDLLSQSRVIAKQLAEVHESGPAFASHPRVADPLCAPGWFACGTAALGFDPLCGDGVGNAAREAILAVAAVRAVLGGADVNTVVDHYRARLLAGFGRHLKLCREFYSSGRSGPWWDEQINACDQGMNWCTSKLQSENQFSYRLRGFSLEPVER